MNRLLDKLEVKGKAVSELTRILLEKLENDIDEINHLKIKNEVFNLNYKMCEAIGVDESKTIEYIKENNKRVCELEEEIKVIEEKLKYLKNI